MSSEENTAIVLRPVPASVAPPFTPSGLVERIRRAFSAFPDGRKGGNNQKYAIEDAALSAFSVFFTQSPSFLDYQRRMQKQRGRSNAQSLFGVHQIPSDNQIRNLLDMVPPETVSPLLADIGEQLYRHGYLDPFRVLDGQLLIALDGTDCFASEKISCPCCTQQERRDGSLLYRHIALTPVIVAPGQSRVVPLAPEFVQPQDGAEKQDCELNAAKRWLAAWGDRYAAWGVTLLGDDLYCHQPLCEDALARGFQVLFVCKPDSHGVLYEWVSDFERTGDLQTLERTIWNGRQRLTERYRFINQVPLCNRDDALLLNWCELTVTNTNGKEVFRNAWATSHHLHAGTVAAIATAGRTRSKIENENNNVLKNQGYHFEHNFGHGKQHLANLLATLIVLAYLVHTTLDWIDVCYRTVRGLLPSRRTFFEHLRALLQYLSFESWDHLLRFMLDELEGKIPDSG